MHLRLNRTKVTFLILSLFTTVGSILYLSSVREYIEFSPDYMGVRSIREICVPFTPLGLVKPEIGKPWRSELMKWLVDEGIAVVPDRIRFWVATSYSAPKKGGSMDCQHFVDMLMDDSWVDWSKKNRRVADVLWPAVVSLSRDSYEGIRVAEKLLNEANILRQRGEADLDAYRKLIEKHKLPDE